MWPKVTMEVSTAGRELCCHSNCGRGLLAGIEEDFTAWKNGFIRDVFPALCGESPLTGLSGVTGLGGIIGVSNDSCECRKKAIQECCKGQVTTPTATVAQSHDSEVTLVSNCLLFV